MHEEGELKRLQLATNSKLILHASFDFDHESRKTMAHEDNDVNAAASSSPSVSPDSALLRMQQTLY